MQGHLLLMMGALGLLAAACGYTGPPAGEVEAVPPGGRVVTEEDLEAVPPGGRVVTEEDPLRVVLAGDSVMADLAPAVIDALEGGGETRAQFVLAPGLRPDPALELLWEQQLEALDPDLIVVLVGTWETTGDSVAPGDPGWRRPYVNRVLEPYIDLISAAGAQVLWIGMPTVPDPEGALRLSALNEVYAELAERRDEVRFVDGASLVAGPDGEYRSIISDEEGTPVRVRRTDDLHLCPAGSIRLAEPVIGHAVDQWEVEVGSGWRAGPWSEPPLLPDPAECPPVAT